MAGGKAPQLNVGGTTVLALVGGVVTGSVALGPAVDSRDPHAVWDVDTIIWKTSRPGVAPIPRLEVYLDDPANPANAQMYDYDGSFGTAGGTCQVARGQTLRAVWTGGQPGDTATFTVTGTKVR